MSRIRRCCVLLTLLLLGCVADDATNPPLHHTVTVAASGTGATGAEGGMGGTGPVDAGPCDAWADDGCCTLSELCSQDALGPCVVDVMLCAGTCAGKPNPAPAKCEDGAGTCEKGVCVVSDAGMGGAAGAGGR